MTVKIRNLPGRSDVMFAGGRVEITVPKNRWWDSPSGKYALYFRFYAPAPDIDQFRQGSGANIDEAEYDAMTGVLCTFGKDRRGGTDEDGRRYCTWSFSIAWETLSGWHSMCADGPFQWCYSVMWYRNGEPVGSDTVSFTLAEKEEGKDVDAWMA